jgi:SPP1 family predicted phage head-tail adaptor
MRTGTLRHLVTVDQPIETQDATGDPVRSWASLGSFWASIEPLRGHEFVAGGAIRAEMDTRIRVRWSKALDGLNERYRINFQDKIYNIVSVAHIGLQHREVEIMAKSGITAG